VPHSTDTVIVGRPIEGRPSEAVIDSNTLASKDRSHADASPSPSEHDERQGEFRVRPSRLFDQVFDGLRAQTPTKPELIEPTTPVGGASAISLRSSVSIPISAAVAAPLAMMEDIAERTRSVR